jgi:hypothetical protein
MLISNLNSRKYHQFFCVSPLNCIQADHPYGSVFNSCNILFALENIKYKYCHLHQRTAQLTDDQRASQRSTYLQKALEFEDIDAKHLDHIDHCTVCEFFKGTFIITTFDIIVSDRRDCEEIRKRRSFGLHLTFLSCGVVVAFDEAIRSEGMRKVTRHLLRVIKHGGELPPALLYDAACSLKLHWQRWRGTQYLENSIDTAQLPYYLAIDKFHQPNHVRSMCKQIMRYDDPSHDGIFAGINTQIAEQFFSYLTKFKGMLRCFSFPRSLIYCLLLFHLHNCQVTEIDPSAYGISKTHFDSLLKFQYTTDTIASSLPGASTSPVPSGQQDNDELEKDEERERQEDAVEKEDEN